MKIAYNTFYCKDIRGQGVNISVLADNLNRRLPYYNGGLLKYQRRLNRLAQ